jgi:hypothetical protein
MANDALDLLRMPGHFLHNRCLRYWICLRRRSAPTVSESADGRLDSGLFESLFNHVQLLHALDDQWECSLGCEDWFLVSCYLGDNFVEANQCRSLSPLQLRSYRRYCGGYRMVHPA